MAINFEWRSGILEAADTKTGIEWCWYKGDTEITRSRDGELSGSVSVPPGSPVTEVKALIREDARSAAR